MSKCKKCNDAISGGALKFKDDKYHPECFVCHHCKGKLSGKSIREHEGNYYDQECFAEHCAKRCGKCGKPCAKAGVSYSCYDGDTFHPECFVCDRCGSSFAGEDAEFYECGDEQLCKSCVEKLEQS